MPERILGLSKQVSNIATSRVDEIRRVTRVTRILAINAAIEAARTNQPTFSVVADEVGSISTKIDDLAEQLQTDLGNKIGELNTLGQKLVANIRGTRLADLSLNMIDIIDRNLYERSCDVRWWATDSAVVDAAVTPSAQTCSYASERLGIILDSYTVYLDLWIAGLDGRVLANGRPKKYQVNGANVSGENWFKQGLATQSGADFVACDIARADKLGNATVATYSTAIREGGKTHGKPIGVLGIFFDWEKQSQVVVDSVRLTDEERSRTRCLMISSAHKVIASSDREGMFESFSLETGGQDFGTYVDASGALVGFALTPGYETYKGLGWYGVIRQTTVN